jgi:putative endonuclease
MKAHQYWVYMVTNKGNTVLYTGMTNDVQRRLFEHRTGVDPDSFAWRYQCWKLVYMEVHTDVKRAIAREKRLKNWKRCWKNELVQEQNPHWSDLSSDWDYRGWYDPHEPPPGYYRQHLVEAWGGPVRDPGSSPG